MSPTNLIGSAEVCRRLEVNAATLSRWVKSGRIVAAQKLPGKNGARLFDDAEVSRFAAERAAQSSEAGVA